jgi:hypothetical protein
MYRIRVKPKESNFKVSKPTASKYILVLLEAPPSWRWVNISTTIMVIKFLFHCKHNSYSSILVYKIETHLIKKLYWTSVLQRLIMTIFFVNVQSYDKAFPLYCVSSTNTITVSWLLLLWAQHKSFHIQNQARKFKRQRYKSIVLPTSSLRLC